MKWGGTISKTNWTKSESLLSLQHEEKAVIAKHAGYNGSDCVRFVQNLIAGEPVYECSRDHSAGPFLLYLGVNSKIPLVCPVGQWGIAGGHEQEEDFFLRHSLLWNIRPRDAHQAPSSTSWQQTFRRAFYQTQNCSVQFTLMLFFF